MRKKLLPFIFLFGMISTLHSQVTSVDYQLKYNDITCQYDAYIIINAGSATTVPQRIQFNAQYSIVVPTGSALTVTESYMPLNNNQFYTGTEPLLWAANYVIEAPAAEPKSDFYSVTPDLGITSHYNDLQAGDTIKLFSVAIDNLFDCAQGVRIFENGIDPASSALGMGNSDFSNGFTLGSINQIYNDNSEQMYPPLPEIVSISNSCENGIEVDLTAEASTCQSPLTYYWTGPSGYSGTNEDVQLPPNPENNGIYKVVVTDALGCKDSITMNATSKPNAGEDMTACTASSITLYGTMPSTGTWSQSNENEFGVSLSPLAGGAVEANITAFATGSYDLIYSIPGCSDTLTLTILEDADCTVSTKELSDVAIKMYPNPTRDRVHVQSNQNIEGIVIYGLDSRVIHAQHFLDKQNERTLSMTALDINSGIYFIELWIDGQKTTKKLHVE